MLSCAAQPGVSARELTEIAYATCCEQQLAFPQPPYDIETLCRHASVSLLAGTCFAPQLSALHAPRIQAIVRHLRAALPSTKLVLLGVLPRGWRGPSHFGVRPERDFWYDWPNPFAPVRERPRARPQLLRQLCRSCSPSMCVNLQLLSIGEEDHPQAWLVAMGIAQPSARHIWWVIIPSRILPFHIITGSI